MQCSDSLWKNVLDLQYSRYLQSYNTSVIVIVSYVIGVMVAYATGQLDSPGHLLVLVLLSVMMVVSSLVIMVRSKVGMQRVTRAILALEAG